MEQFRPHERSQAIGETRTDAKAGKPPCATTTARDEGRVAMIHYPAFINMHDTSCDATSLFCQSRPPHHRDHAVMTPFSPATILVVRRLPAGGSGHT